MAQLKWLATKNEEDVVVWIPLSSEEVSDRVKQYIELTPSRFSKRYNDLLYRPVTFNWNGNNHQIQYNFCTNPYCKWHGMPQERFTSVKSKPSRYRLSGRGKGERQSIICNDDPVGITKGMTWGCITMPVSNWSIAEEIKRLVRIETVRDIEPEY